MSKNKSDQNAHEEQVFNDVLKLSMVSGGYKKKAALKVGGSINAGSECPDIVITLLKMDPLLVWNILESTITSNMVETLNQNLLSSHRR